MPTNPPAGYNTITPYAVVADPHRLIRFVEQAFGGVVINKNELPDGRVTHAEVRLGDSLLMLAGSGEATPPFPAMLHVYIDDVDSAYAAGLAAGATPLREPEDQFYGDRMAGLVDPEGNQWWLATHIEDVSEEEMARRLAARTG